MRSSIDVIEVEYICSEAAFPDREHDHRKHVKRYVCASHEEDLVFFCHHQTFEKIGGKNAESFVNQPTNQPPPPPPPPSFVTQRYENMVYESIPSAPPPYTRTPGSRSRSRSNAMIRFNWKLSRPDKCHATTPPRSIYPCVRSAHHPYAYAASKQASKQKFAGPKTLTGNRFNDSTIRSLQITSLIAGGRSERNTILKTGEGFFKFVEAADRSKCRPFKRK